MIKELSGLPPRVIGFEISRKVQAADFRDVVLPAFERAAKAGAFRAIIVIPEFEGMSSSALCQDLKIGIAHLRDWKRIALVTDIDWMIHLTQMFGWMTPGDVKAFPLNKRTEAIEWVAAD